MTAAEPNSTDFPLQLQSRSYRITVDEGRDSFFALSLEDDTSEDAWLMSDTVRSLDNMR